MKGKILLIDDDRLPTDYYAYALKEEGMDVTHCEDANAARQQWRDLQPALVILDIMMPPGTEVRAEDTKEGLHSGIVLYKLLRQDLPTTPVIVLTNLLAASELFLEDDGNLRVLRKARVPPLELAAISKLMLAEVG